MTDHNGSADPMQKEIADSSDAPVSSKGKGKAVDVPQDVSMGEEETEDDSSEDEVDEVCFLSCKFNCVDH